MEQSFGGVSAFPGLGVLSVVAQAPSPAPVNGGGGAGAGALFFPAIMIAMVIFLLLSSRSQKRREVQEREGMFNRLAKNDRVLTVGGVIGTVLTVKDNEVVLKVDETTNTKMTFVKSAIQRILNDSPASDSQNRS
jgi:preprotein translocase subunit YajC